MWKILQLEMEPKHETSCPSYENFKGPLKEKFFKELMEATYEKGKNISDPDQV